MDEHFIKVDVNAPSNNIHIYVPQPNATSHVNSSNFLWLSFTNQTSMAIKHNTVFHVNNFNFYHKCSHKVYHEYILFISNKLKIQLIIYTYLYLTLLHRTSDIDYDNFPSL